MRARITTENPDLTTVFGELEDSRRRAVVMELARAEDCLLGLRDELIARTGDAWQSDALCLHTVTSGHASIDGYVENDELTFAVELRPRGSRALSPSQPGDPPQAMPTDAWDVEAMVFVVSDAPVNYGQDTAAELPAGRHERAEEAAAALADVCAELRRLALARPAEAAAWRNP